MRRRIIEALTYPRILLLANLDPDECPQNLYYDAGKSVCRHCNQSEECIWLNHNDEFSMLAQTSLESLFESLSFSIDYVHMQCTRADHNVRRCACESCVWIRDARRLAREYENQISKQ